jgi:hypothetical protein
MRLDLWYRYFQKRILAISNRHIKMKISRKFYWRYIYIYVCVYIFTTRVTKFKVCVFVWTTDYNVYSNCKIHLVQLFVFQSYIRFQKTEQSHDYSEKEKSKNLICVLKFHVKDDKYETIFNLNDFNYQHNLTFVLLWSFIGHIPTLLWLVSRQPQNNLPWSFAEL